MIYDSADRAIKEMNRRNLKAFQTLKLAKWDELNVIRQVKSVYDASDRFARKKYYEIAVEAYIVALYEARCDHVRATRMADDAIDIEWVLLMLEEVDPVTLYAFLPEKERKEERLVEAMTVAQDKGKEIDKALRYWTLQVGQYAINAVDRARIQAFKDYGVKQVMWNTEKDERVCKDCEPLDGQVFDIDSAPSKLHVNCRCWYTPVLG